MPGHQTYKESRIQKPGRGYGRVLDLLMLVVNDNRGFTLSEISRKLSIPKSTVSLLLEHLCERGFIMTDMVTRRYQVGPSLVQLSYLVTGQQKLTRIARPYLEWLSRETTEDVYLGVRTGTQVIYVDKVEGAQSVRLNIGIGFPRPMHSTALGRIFLAYGGDGLLEQVVVVRGLPKITDHTVTDIEILRAELERVRARGFSISDGESVEGVCALAAPIRDHSGEVVAALSVSGVRSRIIGNQQFVVESLLKAAHQFQMALGGPGQFHNHVRDF